MQFTGVRSYLENSVDVGKQLCHNQYPTAARHLGIRNRKPCHLTSRDRFICGPVMLILIPVIRIGLFQGSDAGKRDIADDDPPPGREVMVR